ncbi:hypothetical protein N7532_007088 [Penicillium argentinense]|uniref:UDP-glucose 6-dehydrogenase n=1 Tax=Penicillium argentinense TaxID=1131581 RepID=A0A9W9FHI8_9EURO|nr:uncharacterized protein N7532_007088 [Penicillium argentinense]KAJ5100087.1 hypothetical protein N7532_007088 [Penicillium argentinense]
MTDDIPMDFLSESSSGSPSISAVSCSTAPTSPSSSPLFRPSEADDLKLAQVLSDLRSEPVQNVCVVGAGYVGRLTQMLGIGGPTAAVLALHHPNITVEVLDRDPKRIQRWKSPHLPVHEPGLDTVVRIVRDGAEAKDVLKHSHSPVPTRRRQNLFFTCDTARAVSRADIVMMAVNTPTKMFGVGAGCATNMAAFDGAMREVAVHAKPGAIIVEKSTVPGGTAERVRKTLATLRPGAPFEVLSNPEFLAEGSAVENLTVPDRVLIGCAQTPSGHQAAQTLANLYAAWVPPSRILETNAWSSELAKLVANAMLAQRISSINSISAICEKTGADVNEIARAIGFDARIGPHFLKAGLGWGGSCFRKDIASVCWIAESLGLDDVAHYWQQVIVMNERQRQRFARKVIDRFEGNLVGRKLAILGFAFKKNTGDTRESLAVDVIRLLLEERPAEIAIFDPYCRREDILCELEAACPGVTHAVTIHPDSYLACSQAHAVLVVTDCDQFRNTPKRSPEGNSNQASAVNSDASHRANNKRPCTRAADETWTHAGVSYQLMRQAECDADCNDCQSISIRPAGESIEWPRIAYNMAEPKWVFDGRSVLDAAELEKLGVRVAAVGRADWKLTPPYTWGY